MKNSEMLAGAVKRARRLYRWYVFYASPSRFQIRRCVRGFFGDGGACRRILEVGAGGGLMAGVLARACGASACWRAEIAPTDATDLVCDWTRLPVGKGTLDCVAAFEVLDHVADPEAALRETWRVLRDGGYLVLSVPFCYGRHDRHDFWRWTPEGLSRLLSVRGFEVLEIRGRGGTFSACVALLGNWVHAKLGPPAVGWRGARGVIRPLWYVGLTMLTLPLTAAAWMALAVDALVDPGSANPEGLVCLARKKVGG
ncbi:MAG TPA: class I SAM-dependent methyltransferase [Planctomycetaceae bacterium]|nr:class I SAM-dependent methyltransferase [Planctomycetaceae bacterium]